MEESLPLPSIDALREIKNDLIGSLQRKQSSFHEGLLAKLLTWSDSTDNSEVLLQIVPSVLTIAKEVPEAAALVRLHGSGLLRAAQCLFNASAPAHQKVALRLLSLLIAQEAVREQETALLILVTALESRLLASLSAETISGGIKSGFFRHLPVKVYEKILLQLMETAANGQVSPVLEPVLSILAYGVTDSPSLSTQIRTTEVEKLLYPLTRSSILPVKLAALHLAAMLIQQQAASESLAQTVTPTLASLCLSLRPEACALLTTVARGNKSVQDLLCRHNFQVSFAEVVLKATRKDILVMGITCLAATVDSSEDARLKVLVNDFFLEVTLNMVTTGDLDLLKAALELLFSLSRSTRGLKPEMITETVSGTLCQLMDHPDEKVKELVLKILCNTVLDYDSLQIDVTVLVGKACKLVALPATRELALWLLKNLTFIEKSELKQAVLEQIALEDFISIASNGSTGEQIQSLGILRNLFYPDCKYIESALISCTSVLFRLFEITLTTQSGDALLHALYALVNVSNGSERLKMLLVESSLVELVMRLMERTQEEVKKAVSEFLINLCWREQFPQAAERIRRLRELGVETRLREAQDAFPHEDLIQKSRSNLGTP